MNYIENDIRRQHMRFAELLPLIDGTDPHGRTLSIRGGELVPGRNRFIDYVLSNCKVPDLFMDCSSKEWSVVIGLDVLYTLVAFWHGQILTSDGERIDDLPLYLKERFRWLELEMSAINPGAKHRDEIIQILKTSYGPRPAQYP